MNQEQLASFREACHVSTEGKFRCSVTYERRLDNAGKYFQQWQCFAFPLATDTRISFMAYSSIGVEDCLSQFVASYQQWKTALSQDYERVEEAYRAATTE